MLMRPCDDPRLLDGLRHSCGPLFMNALEDPDVIEIMLNPDGSLWIEKYGQEHEPIGVISVAQSRLILSQVASGLDLTVNEKNPIVEGEFPLDGSRFEGTFPPIVGPGPSFSLRKKASRVFTLEEYMLSRSLTPEAVSIIEEAVRQRQNIVVVGGTSSGKTTFVNAVIDAISRLTPSHRLIILEDTAELQSKSPNTVFLRTSVLAEVDMRKLAKVSMRYAPKRILVGEVRDAAALEMLKLWNTGHPGGVSTFHADSAEEALERLEELVEEAGLGPKQKLIGRAVDLAVYMEKTPDNRRQISSIIKVNKFNHKKDFYETETLYLASAA
ncbi:P-type conjugative transfer ATPase TrbB [Bilophila wadsworthia]|uniref:P-type conjugative transfer ATPase TrbB n=1 Tax=Bilophila wadsworthia TaxID=35833 RepID=UPI001D0A323C|nr:P-type conjugative transfer ATPase TrbB [Bilophila wadsworthia]MCB8572309.1 P-type conjugative transfer ATPase TrbB [Bilophila wadsworthia]MCC2715295.1 P-type conjugative transfer ATPase TrbB [Bilophila wadsworthia]